MSWTKRLIEKMQEGMSEEKAQAYVAQKRKEQEEEWRTKEEHVCSCGEPKDPSDKRCRACQAEDEADFKAHRRREDRI